jgi:hypothetical protein
MTSRAAFLAVWKRYRNPVQIQYFPAETLSLAVSFSIILLYPFSFLICFGETGHFPLVKTTGATDAGAAQRTALTITFRTPSCNR